MKVKIHSQLDILTFKAFGTACFFGSYYLITVSMPAVDLTMATIIAGLLAYLCFWVMRYLFVRSNGVSVEVAYSSRSENSFYVRIYRGFRRIKAFRVVHDRDENSVSRLSIKAVKGRLHLEFSDISGVFVAANEWHFVGLEKEDASAFIRVIELSCIGRGEAKSNVS